MSDTPITRRDHTNTWSRETTEDHHFQLQPFKGYVLEVEDVHFHHDSAVLLPDYGESPDPARVTGLSVLAAAYDHAEKNPAQQLLDAGHTDTTGQDDYNLKLSVQRADSVLHALLGNRSGWVAVTLAKNKVEDYQQVVKWTSWAYGWDSDPGPIDNVHGSQTTAGVKSFQRNYNETFSGSLAVDGVVGEKTWGAMFDVYMDYLKKMLDVDDAGLEAARGKLHFLGPKRVGCGENFPIEAPRHDNYRSKINRRVELLFYEPDQVPKLDCHSGSCTPILCEVYNPKMYKYTHITPVPKPPKDSVYDLTNVKAPTHIAPSKEKIKIEYDVVNQGSVITSGKLEIFRKKDDKNLKKFDLTPEQYTEGHHDNFEWDGAVTKDAEFPDGFVTIEHSDYVVKVTVTGPKGDKSGKTEIKVELKDFKVELAPKAVLTKDRDKEVYDTVGAIPAGALVKLYLKSNVFTVSSGGDEMVTQAAYTQYEKLWGGGPRVPFYAIATVIDSKGNAVPCGNAMGRAKVLWDFTDPKQTLDTYLATAMSPPPAHEKSAGAKPYIDKALNYDKAATRPKNGDNCHLDRGGKRTSASGPPIFHGADAGTQNFPFKVDKGATRFWGCFAKFEKSGADDGRAGAIFRPARHAGDNYSVTAYLDLTVTLDTADETPSGALRQVKVGDFEIWRRVSLIEQFKKGTQTTGTMPSFAEYYADAYIEVKDERGSVKDMAKADYDTLFTAGFAAAGGNSLVRQYGLTSGSQWDAPVPTGAAPPPAASPSPWIATFLPNAQFRAAVSTGTGKTGAGLQSHLDANNCGNTTAYADRIQDLCIRLGVAMTRIKATKEGITVLQFNGTNNMEPLCSTPWAGWAVPQSTEAKRANGGFLLFQTGANSAQTPAHEIGHVMFLPHSPRIDKTAGTVINSGGGITPDFHDGANMNCLMSYARPRPGFCGLCLLRLRGWKGDEFDRNGPKTVK